MGITKCPKCNSDLRFGTEQVGVDNSNIPIYHRFGYCDKCRAKYDIDILSKQAQAPTKPCKHCKLMIPKGAKVCPYCHKKQKHIFLGIVLIIVGLFGLTASCSSILSDSDSSQPTQTTASTSSTTIEEGYATLDKFNQIETDMAYEEVVEIMGSEGTVMSESEVMGIKTVMYYWYAENGIANMNIMVQDNKVISKAQIGLD